VISEFTVDIPNQITILIEALTSGDSDFARKQAHTIKGAAANVSADRLRALAFEMEQAAGAEDLTRVKDQLGQLEEEYQALVNAFSESGFAVSNNAA
jgi:HPt (histidine-containing phosphotransfer) domain-containing protein